MKMRRASRLTCFVLLLAVPLPAQGQPPQPGQGLTGFVPIGQLPPSDQLPAAPYLIAAYLFVWLAAIFYIWSVWRRMDKVQSEIRMLQRQG
jgi:CcmD family protein